MKAEETYTATVLPLPLVSSTRGSLKRNCVEPRKAVVLTSDLLG